MQLVSWCRALAGRAELRRYAMLSMNSILFAAPSNPSEFGLTPVMHSSQSCCRQCREPMWSSESGREALVDRTISLKELRCACHCWLVNCAMCKDLSCVECYCTVTLNGPVRHLQCNFQNVWKMCVCVQWQQCKACKKLYHFFSGCGSGCGQCCWAWSLREV